MSKRRVAPTPLLYHTRQAPSRTPGLTRLLDFACATRFRAVEVTTMDLVWTKKPPTEPGWWWCRVDVDDAEIILLWTGSDGLVYVGETGATIDGLTMWDCEWAGPVPEPKEPS